MRKSPGSSATQRVMRWLLVACSLVGGVAVPARTAQASVVSGSFIQAGQIVQLNTKGGNGSALTGFNPYIWTDIYNSISARSPYPNFIDLNEVCQEGRDQLVYALNVAGYGRGPSNPSGYSYDNTVSLGAYLGGQIGMRPAQACGSWYGNMVLIRGEVDATVGASNWFKSQAADTSGERRSWICRKSVLSPYVFCGTHARNGCNSVTNDQIQEYRNIGTLFAGSGDYLLGDLNCVPYLDGWQANGFSETDLPPGPSGFISTTDAGNKLDYIWRRNTPAFAHPPYVFSVANSDHHWVQAYV